MYARLSALPESAGPIPRAQLTAAVTAGTELLRLQRAARIVSVDLPLQRAFIGVSEGNRAAAVEALAQADQDLARARLAGASLQHLTRARASIVALTEILDRHAAYLCPAAP